MLGKKQFSLAKPLTNVANGEEVFTIVHTKEQFRSKEYLFVARRLLHPRWRRTCDNVHILCHFVISRDLWFGRS
jgi:hypothetical protein